MQTAEKGLSNRSKSSKMLKDLLLSNSRKSANSNNKPSQSFSQKKLQIISHSGSDSRMKIRSEATSNNNSNNNSGGNSNKSSNVKM